MSHTIQEIKIELETMDQPYPAILDYLETTDRPTVDGYFEYLADEESSYASQSRWDARQTHSAIAVGKSIDGSGVAALMGNLRKGA